MSKRKNGTLVGIAMSILIFGALGFILVREPFPESSYTHSEEITILPSDGIGRAMSGFLWNFRGFDLLFQSLILFTTAICCLALLREGLR